MVSNRTSTVILAAAVTIGVAADQLFRAPEWGINLPIAAAMLAAAGLAMPADEGRASPWPWLASVFFAAMWAVRDAEALRAFDLLAALGLASLPLLRERSIAVRTADLIEMAFAPLRTAWAVSFGTFDFGRVLRAHALPASRTPRGHWRAIGAGALLAAPLVLVFGSLFASADPVFDAAVGSFLDGGIGPIAGHAIVAGAFAWASAGYLWMLAKPPRTATEPVIQLPEFGRLQVLTPLVTTVVLFGVFVAVQATSLFGGASFVESTTGLTFAEYARRGFFQLVFASALVLPLIYFAPTLAGPMDQAATTRLRVLLGVQLGFTALVLASALWRMGLYVQMYGLTEDRVNGTMVMIWIAGTISVFALTVVRGRPQHAAFGSVIAAVVALAALNLANPQALIARYNLANQGGREIDFEHIARLGGDAVPILTSQMDLVPADRRCKLIADLRRRYVASESDWRAWNLVRARAREAVMGLRAGASCATPAATPPATSGGTPAFTLPSRALQVPSLTQ